ncbi:MAG: dolichyl-phosphate beta-glucosyltransferase [Chloroflexota bacterium]
MPVKPSVSLILPAYNEARRIGQTVAEAVEYFDGRQMDYEILVVAEGDDGTHDVVAGLAAANSRLRLLGGKQRLGKGHAIRGAVVLAEKTIVGFSDADNKTPIDEFDKLLPLLEEGYDLVIGSRGMGESKIERAQPLYRRVGSTGFRVFMHLATGLSHVPDTQCGFKFFQHAVAKDLFARQRIDGYMFDVEILYLAQRSGYKLGQVPIRWRDDGDSRLQLVAGNLRNVRDVLSIRFTRRTCGSS